MISAIILVCLAMSELLKSYSIFAFTIVVITERQCKYTSALLHSICMLILLWIWCLGFINSFAFLQLTLSIDSIQCIFRRQQSSIMLLHSHS